MLGFFDDFLEDTLAGLSVTGVISVLRAVVIFLVCCVVIRILLRLAEKLLRRSSKLDGTLKSFLLSALRIALWALAIVIIAQALGIPTASLVAVISIAGLALSLSLQNILANLFSGITLLFTRPFAQGDLVELGTNTGVVQRIGLFYTVIDTPDKRMISIPNSDVTAASVVNYSREPLRRVDMCFSADYDDATEAVRAAILEAAGADDRILSDPAPFIAIGQFKDSAVEYVVRLWCQNSDYWDVYFGMNERVRDAFEHRGVHMTYNHLNVHVCQ